MVSKHLDIHIQKSKPDLYLLFTKMNTKYITDLNVKLKTTKFPESTGENLCGLELGNDLENMKRINCKQN